MNPAAILAFCCLSLPESPVFDPAGQILEFPSAKNCTLFRFVADVVNPGLLTTAARVACKHSKKS